MKTKEIDLKSCSKVVLFKLRRSLKSSLEILSLPKPKDEYGKRK